MRLTFRIVFAMLQVDWSMFSRADMMSISPPQGSLVQLVQ
jgi:hypothetical protein